MKQFLIRRWFLITLVVTMSAGLFAARPLEPLADVAPLRYGIVASVLFVMALPLEARAMWRSMRRPWAPLLAVAVNFGILPLLAWGISLGLSETMAGGLLVVAATPSTLASASVWTRRAGGNDSVSILGTIITNGTCFVITPLWLVTMTGQTANIELGSMVTKLGLLVVLPMTLAQLLRLYRPLAWWSAEHKVALGVWAQMGILSMVLLGAIRTGLQLSSQSPGALLVADMGMMVVAVLVVHVGAFGIGLWLARCFGMPRGDCIAVGFSGSQKTLMVGLQMALELQLNILPMVTYHVAQLFVDTLFADHFRRQETQPKPPGDQVAE